METETVKPPKALPNTLRRVMPRLVVATKLSQGKEDLGDPILKIYLIVSTHTLSEMSWSTSACPSSIKLGITRYIIYMRKS